MTTDAVTQLAILADALTEIVDLATGGEKHVGAAGRSAGAGRGHRRRSAGRRRDLRAVAAVGGSRRDAGRGGEFRRRRRRRDGALTVSLTIKPPRLSGEKNVR